MEDTLDASVLSIYLEEYSKLKDEQISRIGFRDNLVYVNLTAVGGIFAFVLSSEKNYEILLIIPWVCFILSWMYISNDEKVSSIGKYLRTNYSRRVALFLKNSEITSDFLGWEFFHRSDKRRVGRKILQFAVDSITFVAPGAISLFLYIDNKNHSIDNLFVSILVTECIILVSTLVKIFRYADFVRTAND